MRFFLFLVLAASAAQAQEAITIQERREIPLERRAAPASHELRLTLAVLDGSGWSQEQVLPAIQVSAGVLAQCGVALENVEWVRIGAPARFRDFATPVSRELSRALPLRKPAVYFVAGTRQSPAFDAEAIGRGNSRSRPELRDTVWVVYGARDLDLVLAHELAHVLMDSGEHSDEPGNLMREETAPVNMRLSEAQCARLRASGAANGLLRPRR